MSASLKSVVVVGGGAAGSVIAKQLAKQKTAKVTLVNPVPYRVLLPATIRMVVSDIDDLENQALVPLDRVFEEPSSPGTFIQAKVLNVHPEQNKIQLDNGEELAYDILVLATGSKWNEPIDFPDDAEGTKTFIRAQREKIAAAKSIVLVGGGAVGIGAFQLFVIVANTDIDVLETAGEIRDIYPEKEITIVHSYNQLLNTAYPDKVRSAAAQAMVSRNIKLVLDDAVDFDTGSDTKTTRRGHTLTADLVVRVHDIDLLLYTCLTEPTAEYDRRKAKYFLPPSINSKRDWICKSEADTATYRPPKYPGSR